MRNKRNGNAQDDQHCRHENYSPPECTVPPSLPMDKCISDRKGHRLVKLEWMQRLLLQPEIQTKVFKNSETFTQVCSHRSHALVSITQVSTPSVVTSFGLWDWLVRFLSKLLLPTRSWPTNISFVQFSCCLPPRRAALYAAIISLPCLAISAGISDDKWSPSAAESNGWSRLPVFSAADRARRLAMQRSAAAAVSRTATPAPTST